MEKVLYQVVVRSWRYEDCGETNDSTETIVCQTFSLAKAQAMIACYEPLEWFHRPSEWSNSGAEMCIEEIELSEFCLRNKDIRKAFDLSSRPSEQRDCLFEEDEEEWE